MKITEDRKQSNNICKVLEKSPTMPYVGKYFWKNESKINIFLDKVKLKTSLAADSHCKKHYEDSCGRKMIPDESTKVQKGIKYITKGTMWV